MMPLPTTARAYAKSALKGQKHRDGKDAVDHSLRVAEGFRDNPMMYCAAVLHDVLEDCPDVTAEQIEELFGSAVAEIVVCLTRGKEESWNSYISRVTKNPCAVWIKIADIHDNIARADQKFQAKMPMYQKTLTLLYHHVRP